MRVQRLVASITDKRAGNSREMDAAVARKNQFGHKEVRQNRLVEIVANLQPRVVLTADQAFNLKRKIAEPRSEKRILTGALDGKTTERTPLRVKKVGLAVSCQGTLIQTCKQDRAARSFAQPAKVATSELNRPQRTGERRLARSKSVAA